MARRSHRTAKIDPPATTPCPGKRARFWTILAGAKGPRPGVARSPRGARRWLNWGSRRPFQPRTSHATGHRPRKGHELLVGADRQSIRLLLALTSRFSSAAGQRPCVGPPTSAPFIVFDDADLEATVNGRESQQVVARGQTPLPRRHRPLRLFAARARARNPYGAGRKLRWQSSTQRRLDGQVSISAALAKNVVEHSHPDDPTRVGRARHASKAAAKALATARLRRAPAFNRWPMTD